MIFAHRFRKSLMTWKFIYVANVWMIPRDDDVQMDVRSPVSVVSKLRLSETFTSLGERENIAT